MTLSFDECWNKTKTDFDPPRIPSQSYAELELFYPYVLKLKPKNVLEIGVQFGGSLIFWINASEDGGKIIGIDNDVLIPERVATWKKWLKPQQKLYVLNKDSRTQETLGEVKTILQGEFLDFLFIDANHEMPSPKIDYEQYSPLVRKGGMIAFHDIGGPPNNNLLGLYQYWESLKQDILKDSYSKTMQFFCRHPTTGISGIGVIMKNET
jgi:cephalosporin hydroxylase